MEERKKGKVRSVQRAHESVGNQVRALTALKARKYVTYGYIFTLGLVILVLSLDFRHAQLF